LFDSIEPGAGNALDRFLEQAAYKYKVGIQEFVWKPSTKITEFLSLRVLIDALRMDVFQSFYSHVRKYFKSPTLLKLMEFPILFLGAISQNTPAMYSLMNYAEIKLGTWYPMGGMHNIENALAAIAVAVHLGIADEKIVAAVADFKGVKRRFEYIEKTADRVMIDDYAHHPQELTALLSSARKLFADRKCTVVFQPHLFSRTNDFADGFATALSLADEVLLLPIYPARELPMPGVTSEMVAGKMNSLKVTCLSKEALMENMQTRKASGNIPHLLITAGAGDIDALVQPIKEILFN
jgi:UDP-N-acetylmuramate-alanine ligase